MNILFPYNVRYFHNILKFEFEFSPFQKGLGGQLNHLSTIFSVCFWLIGQVNSRSGQGWGLIWKDQIDYWGQPWGNMIYIAGVLSPGLWLLRSSPRPRSVWSPCFSTRCENCCNFISRWPPKMMTLHPHVYAPVASRLEAIFCLISVLFLIVIFSSLR